MSKTMKLHHFRPGNIVSAEITENGMLKTVQAMVTITSGCWLHDECNIVQVLYQDEELKVKEEYVESIHLKGIQLNQDYMKRLGFKKRGVSTFEYPHEVYRIIMDWEDSSIHVFYCGHPVVDLVKLRTVHEVQNFLDNEWLCGEMPIFSPFK